MNSGHTKGSFARQNGVICSQVFIRLLILKKKSRIGFHVQQIETPSSCANNNCQIIMIAYANHSANTIGLIFFRSMPTGNKLCITPIVKQLDQYQYIYCITHIIRWENMKQLLLLL